MVDPAGKPVLVVLPGRAYRPERPLLSYAIAVAESRGWAVVTVDWTDAPDPSEHSLVEHATRVLDGVDAQRVRVVVGKSLGSLLAGPVAERGIPALWLTPLLRHPPVVAGLARVSAPTALVGGGADEAWDEEVARATGLPVLVLPGGDHALMRPGDVRGSVLFHAEVAGMLDAMLRNATGDAV